MGIETFGFDDYKKAAAKIIQDYPEKGAEFLNTQGKNLARKVRSRTVKGPTGKLKKSWRKTKPKNKRGEIICEVKSTSPHAHLYEYGHNIKNQKDGPVLGFVPGRHPLQTSFDEVNAEWDKDAEKWFDDLVKELEL